MAEAARQAARRIYKRYNYSNGPFSSYELSSLLTETYDIVKIPYKPTQNDINAYERVLDADGDGTVTLQDFENKAIEYLCGPGVLGEAPTKSSSANYQTYDYEVKPSIRQETSYTSQAGNYGYSYKQQSYQQQPQQSYQSTQQQQQQSYEASRQQQQQSTQSTQQQSYESSRQQQSYHKTEDYQQEEEQRPYSEAVREYLTVVGKVFMNYANPEDFTVTENEVPSLLSDTYAVLGREGYYPSEDDTRAWMRLCDVNNDGKVEFQDYEYFVVKSLERSGLDLYD